EFEHLCIELGLSGTIIPARTIGCYLSGLFEGRDHMEILALVKDEARAFTFVATAAAARPEGDIDLPAGSRVMFFYRDERFTLPEADTRLAAGDEVVVVTHSRNLEALQARWRKALKAG